MFAAIAIGTPDAMHISLPCRAISAVQSIIERNPFLKLMGSLRACFVELSKKILECSSCAYRKTAIKLLCTLHVTTLCCAQFIMIAATKCTWLKRCCVHPVFCPPGVRTTRTSACCCASCDNAYCTSSSASNTSSGAISLAGNCVPQAQSSSV